MCNLKNAKCKKCGTKENLTRHHIIPMGILKQIREIKNLYQKRVYVVLCKKCHKNYEKKARHYKNKLLKKTIFNFKEKISLQGRTLTYLKSKDRTDMLAFVVKSVGKISEYSMKRYSKLNLEIIIYKRMTKRMTVGECINLGNLWINHFKSCTGIKLNNSQYKLIKLSKKY